MPIKREPQPTAIPTESPLESEPLAQIYAQQTVKKQGKKLGKFFSLIITVLVIVLLLLVIFKITGIKITKSEVNPQLEPTPTPTDEVIIGPVNQYATHSATRQIEEAIDQSEKEFKNIRFREDAYLPPTIDLNVSL